MTRPRLTPDEARARIATILTLLELRKLDDSLTIDESLEQLQSAVSSLMRNTTDLSAAKKAAALALNVLIKILAHHNANK